MRPLLIALSLMLLVACGQEAPPPDTLAGAAERTDDYMTPALRAEVERLKQAVEEIPSDQTNANERARTLFHWINSWALAGRYVPVNATATVARVNAYGQPSGPELDAFIKELALLDESPEALGELELKQDEPFTAREFATFSQVYTVGATGVEDGGGFIIAKHFQTNHPQFQLTDPSAPSYVSVTSSNPDVSFTPGRVQVSGMHGGFRGAEGQHAVRLSGRLEPGDTVTFTYGDTSGGSPGLRMPDFASDEMPFPIYVTLDENDLWLSLPIQPVAIIGAELYAVQGFAPSIIATGETVEVSIRGEDRYGNRAEGEIPDWIIFDGDTRIATVETGNEAVVTTDLSFETEGVHRLRIESSDGNTIGEFNPIRVETDPDQRIFWGDTHGHSGFAEGVGSAERFMQFARDEARLDFVTHSEHDIWMDDGEWETLRELVIKYREDGRFAPYLGYEWTVSQSQGGHHNVLFRTPEGRDRVPSQFYPLLSSLYQGLRTKHDTNDVVIIPHAHQKGEYRYSDPEMETLVEIMSMHGTFEWFGRMYLNHGHEVGFVAASDDHIGRPGYAAPKSSSLAQRGGLGAIFAPEHSADAIFDGMKQLRAYATTGQRMLLDFAVNGTPIGQRARYSDERQIEANIVATAPLRSVTIFRNDKVLEHKEYGDNANNELLLTFWSDSYAYHPQDNPRGWRHWQGTLTVEGSDVEGAELVDFQNLAYQSLEQDPDNPNQYTFHTITRGDHSSIILRLDGINRNTRVKLNLEEATETGSGPPLKRTHQVIPGSSVTLAPGDKEAMTVDGYDDAISLSRNTVGPLETSISLTDSESPRDGDYYFMRVRQADEGIGWTSPVWIGGSPPR